MDEDDVKPTGDVVALLVKEDLEPLSLEMLEERISFLKKEIRRAEQMISSKNSVRSAAENLFKS